MWTGALEGRVLGNCFTNWGGSNLFWSQLGEGNSFFWQGKNYSMLLLFCIHKQSYNVPVKINLIYLQVSKNHTPHN